MATQKILVHNIELAKFMRIEQPDLNNPLHRWLYYLTHAYMDPEKWKEVVSMSPGLSAFKAKHDRAPYDPELTRWARKVNEGILDQLAREESLVQEAMEQGIEQGIEQGSEARGVKIAINMLRAGMDYNVIAKITELPINVITLLADDVTKSTQ